MRTAKTLLVLLGVTVLAWSAGSAPVIRWHQGPSLPGPRDRLGCGVMNGLFVLVGGAYWENEEKHYHSETIAFSPATNKWIRLPHIPRAGSYGASAVLRDNRGRETLVVAGGASESGATSACYRLVKNGKYEWKPLPNLPAPTAGASGASVGSKFYLFGGAPGLDEAALKHASSALLELDVAAPNARWTAVRAGEAPLGRVGAALASVGKRLYVFGGYGVGADGSVANLGDAYVIDLSRRTGRAWKRLKDLPQPARWMTAVALDTRYIGLLGGYTETFVPDVLIYDTETDEYFEAAPLPYAACTLAVGVVKDTLFVAGGEDKPRHRTDAVAIGRITRGPR